MNEIKVVDQSIALRYVDNVEVGDEVLVQGNDEPIPVNITNKSSEILQVYLYCFILYVVTCYSYDS